MKYYFKILFCCLGFSSLAQTLKPDVQDKTLWTVKGRQIKFSTEDNKRMVSFDEQDGSGMQLLNNYSFTDGTIEFDVKGKNVPQKSFVGLAFQVQNDSIYEAIYFRPFNFMNVDTSRRSRSVQYICIPNYDWQTLRTNHPGVYENKANPFPLPDDWFHVKIVIEGFTVSTFINHSTNPSLVVKRLTTPGKGKIGFWVGNGSDGSFSNLIITPKPTKATGTGSSGKINYGNNPAAGSYVQVGDTKLYVETYGSGPPIVLLHGGVYGYIDEFEPFINKLSTNYRVICLATRGHGKSEIGRKPFSWEQRADDAYQVIKSMTDEPVTLLGFSDGAYTGYKLAARYPQMVKKLIAIGAGDRPKNDKGINLSAYSATSLLRDAKDFFESRLTLMPEPERWGESLGKLNDLYNKDYISKETFAKIECPTLVMGGDRDEYFKVDKLTSAQQMISQSQLAIINGCGHVVFFCNWDSVWSTVNNFLNSSF